MEKQIIQRLREIEQKGQIKIHFAIESGSRAWGFHSPDSDYDVRFIYSRELDHYLSLKESADTLNFPINDDLDLVGWDIKKSLSLLWKSNASLLGWIYSPMIYFWDDDFAKELKQLADSCFSPIAVFHHFHSMSKKYIELCKGTYKLKHLFYALRTVFSAQWIIQNGSCPPVNFIELLDGIEVDLEQKRTILSLIELKAKKSESFISMHDKLLVDYLLLIFSDNEAQKDSLMSNKGKVKELEDFFQRTIKKV